MQPLNATNKDLIIGWLSRLSKHFSYEVSEEQIDIFVKALIKDRPGQINAAFDACLNECEFFPRLADVHKRMPEFEPGQQWDTRYRILTLELVRPIATEICKEMTGRELDELQVGPAHGPRRDEDVIKKVFRTAAIIRYLRMGIKVTWIPLPELEVCKVLAQRSTSELLIDQ